MTFNIYEFIDSMSDNQLIYLSEKIDQAKANKIRETQEAERQLEEEREAKKYCKNGHYMSSRERRKSKCDRCKFENEFNNSLFPKPYPMKGVK